MKNEDRIVEILSELLVEFREIKVEFKEMKGEFIEMKGEQKETNKRLASLEDDMHISHSILKHQEGWLRLISDVLNKEVAKYDQVMTIEHLNDGRIVLHKA